MTPDRTTVVLEIATDRRPIEGIVTAGTDTSRPFSGWVGLLALLGEIVDGPPASPHTPRDREAS